MSIPFQNPPVIPSQELFEAPKGLLRRCLGVQTPTHKVFGKTRDRKKHGWFRPAMISLASFTAITKDRSAAKAILMSCEKQNITCNATQQSNP